MESGTCGSLMDHSSAESGHTYIITPHLHLSGKRAEQRGTLPSKVCPTHTFKTEQISNQKIQSFTKLDLIERVQ